MQSMSISFAGVSDDASRMFGMRLLQVGMVKSKSMSEKLREENGIQSTVERYSQLGDRFDEGRQHSFIQCLALAFAV